MLKLSTIILLTTSALWCVFFELVSGLKIVESKPSIPSTIIYSKTKAHQPKPFRIQNRASVLQFRLPDKYNSISLVTNGNTRTPQSRKPLSTPFGDLDNHAKFSSLQRPTIRKRVVDTEPHSEIELLEPGKSRLWKTTPNPSSTLMGIPSREESNLRSDPTLTTNARVDKKSNEEEILPVSDVETQDSVSDTAEDFYGSDDMLSLLESKEEGMFRKDHLEKCNSETGFECYESKWKELGLDVNVMKQYSELIGLGKHVPMTGPGTMQRWKEMYKTEGLSEEQWEKCEEWFQKELGAGEKTLRDWVTRELVAKRNPRLPVWWTDEMLGKWLSGPAPVKKTWFPKFQQAEQEHTTPTTNGSPRQHQKPVEEPTSPRRAQKPREKITLRILMHQSDQETMTDLWKVASPKLSKAIHFTIPKAVRWSKLSQNLWQKLNKSFMNRICQSSQSTNRGEKLGKPKRIKG